MNMLNFGAAVGASKIQTFLAGMAISAAVTLFAAPAFAASPVFETNFGTAVLSGDDNTANGTLPFSFQFYGTSYTNYEVSTNGFVSFGNNGAGCCTGDAAGLLAGAPRIAPEWFDIVDTVRVNNDVAGRTVFTWSGGEFSAGGSYNIQAQLFSSGLIIFGYDNANIPASHQSLSGISPGGGASDPGGSDLSNANFTTSASVYQQFGANTFDLNNTNVFFTPDGNGGYAVTNSGDVGGVPEPASWALMLVGFGGLGAVLRRRRGQVALTA